MTKVEIGFAGNTLVEDVTVAVPRTTAPTTATPPNIGLIEISAPTVPIPGPPGEQGPPGETGPPGTTHWADITDKPATFPPTVPIAQSDVAGLVTDLDNRVMVTGDTMTGDLTISKATGGPPTLTLIGNPTDNWASLVFRSKGTGGPDWDFGGNDTGFYIDRYSDYDSGSTTLDTPFIIDNAGIVDMPFGATTLTPPTADNDTSVATTAYVKANLATIVGGAIIADAAPASPKAGQLWYESDTGNTFIWYTDADSSQWVQQNVNSPGPVVPAELIASPSADMFAGFTTSPGNRFRVNDKVDGTGTDVAFINEAGVFQNTGSVQIGNGILIGMATPFTIASPTGTAGSIQLRPNGYNDPTNQVIVNNNGTVTLVAVGATSNLQAGTFSATGATAGVNATLAGRVNSSVTATTSTTQYSFYNPNGVVGTINTNASATGYNTSSDERLKDVGADYDPAEAIAIIRADPVKNFQWKTTGTDAVGWIAQRSHAINEDLATYVAPREAGGKGEPAQEEFWGIDYGRRTPYLWAALANALDRIDQLEAKLALLEGKP